MKYIIGKLKDLSWIFHKEITLFEAKGLYSMIKVTKRASRITLYTGKNHLQTTLNGPLTSQSNFFTWYLAAPWFSGNFSGEIKSMLILGLGGGSQVKYYNQVYNVKQITGVEIDPIIVDIGKKYFDLNDSNLRIINADGYEFVRDSRDNFDLIIVDMFKENVSENDKQSLEFIKNSKLRMNSQGILFINKLKYDASNASLEKSLKEVFNKVYSIEVFYTMFYIATDSECAPVSVRDIQYVLNSGFKFSYLLTFLRRVNKKKLRVIK